MARKNRQTGMMSGTTPAPGMARGMGSAMAGPPIARLPMAAPPARRTPVMKAKGSPLSAFMPAPKKARKGKKRSYGRRVA